MKFLTALVGSLLIVAASSAAIADTRTLVFQEGDGGASSDMHGAYVQMLSNAGYGSSPTLDVSIDYVVVDFAVGKMAFLWFPNMFGENTDQIPLDSHIESATLELVRVGAGTQGEIFRRLLETWDENTITGMSYPGSATAYRTIPPAAAGPQEIDLTTMVQTWALGTANFGLMIGYGSSLTLFEESFYSDDEAVVENRPKLTVVFTPPPLAATEATTWGKVKALYR
jgi:hypothetical protein